MRSNAKRAADRGPFRVDQIRDGDPYELSNGHAIYCAPTGGRGADPNRLGASVVGWDPAVKEAGVDAGYAIEPGTLRAPDVAVGNVPDKPGWIAGVPELAIEYADVGQDEAGLKSKIEDLLGAGTRYLWVVRLTGLRRVEVHEPGKKMRVAHPGEMIAAPGVLQNPVLVEALYDRDAAERATFTNLLQRRGFTDLEEVLAKGRAEGRSEGRAEGLSAGRTEALVGSILTVLEARDIAVPRAVRKRIEQCTDAGELGRLLRRAAVVDKASDLFESKRRGP